MDLIERILALCLLVYFDVPNDCDYVLPFYSDNSGNKKQIPNLHGLLYPYFSLDNYQSLLGS